jgi:hypothetical protein
MNPTKIPVTENDLCLYALELKTCQGIVRRLREREREELVEIMNGSKNAKKRLAAIKKDIKFEQKQLRKAEIQIYKQNNRFEAEKASEYVKTMLAKEKSGVKIKKGQFSEPILKSVSKLPEDITSLIYTFLPLEVKNRVLFAKFSMIFQKSKSQAGLSDDIKPGLLFTLCLRREFLPLLSSKQARNLVERSYFASHVRFTNYSGKTELKNKIFMVLGLAMEKNPLLAQKMLKTSLVLAKPGLRLSDLGEMGQILTMEDLPEEYK